ncbi:uncharacterized protein LOC136751677 [Amia ocellicauda]|uniref:uncharacterized protein LOC136751677 n=1 Tax=Amia ocellicauda TaxID=2972642 RepID=UPI003464288B
MAAFISVSSPKLECTFLNTQCPRASSQNYLEGFTFYDEFRNNPRFTVQKDKGLFHLNISRAEQSDAVTYYCVTIYQNSVQFGNGTVLMLKGKSESTFICDKSNRTIVQQPASVPVQPGDSVTLQCTIHTETCAGEHSVHWFRHGSGEALPGLIYTHGNRSDPCESSSEPGLPAQGCVYELPKRNLRSSDAGTYYCAVATCGQILFGNGTRLDIAENALTSEKPLIPQNQDTELVNYAALKFTANRAVHPGRRRRETDPHVLYADESCPQPRGAAAMITLRLTLAILWTNYVFPEVVVSQPRLSVSARLGDPVTLQCYTGVEMVKTWMWLKHTIGQAPRTVITTYYDKIELYGDFNNTRVIAKKDNGNFTVTFSHTKSLDVATYYCGIQLYSLYHYGNGTFVMLKGSKSVIRRVEQQPASVPVQPGDSVTLQCTIHTETCAGEHSVHWFRHGSGEALPGLIYTHGNRSDPCESSSEPGLPAQGCVYELPKRNLCSSDAGTYYCAVATCGQILFGNGTRLDIAAADPSGLFPLVLALGLSNAVCVLVIAVLVCTRNTRCAGNSGAVQESPNSDPLSHQSRDADVLNYAALSFTGSRAKPGRKRREMDTQAVYADVRCQQWD